MFNVEANFIGSFKIGDNINHNLKILALLYNYHAAETSENQPLLNKPITITIISVIEAVLYDFQRVRINTFTKEGVISLAQEVIDHFRDGKFDKFEKYIVFAKKYDLFGASGSKFYFYLESLRKLRN